MPTPNIFVSHSHHDNLVCRQIVADLRRSFPDAHIFYDESELHAGEWERATRGTNGRIYPWSNTWDAPKANTRESKVGTTSPVGNYAEKGDASPCEAHAQAANVWEWPSSIWQVRYDVVKCENDNDNLYSRALRGSSWFDDARYARGVAHRTRAE